MAKLESSRPLWIGAAGRVIAFTFLLTLLSFAIALLASILGTIVHAQVKHVVPNLMFAYKHIAFPIALVVGAVVLVVTLFVEVRNYRRGRVLASIEQTMTLSH